MLKCLCTGILGLIFITGCQQTVTNSEKAASTAVPATVSPLHYGTMSGYIDLFLTSGNYGLGDTANVKVIKTISNEQ